MGRLEEKYSVIREALGSFMKPSLEEAGVIGQ